jgi:hypothetical protein
MYIYLIASLLWATFAACAAQTLGGADTVKTALCFVVNFVLMPVAVIVFLVKTIQQRQFPLPACKIRK